jgi:thioredoxin-related protein
LSLENLLDDMIALVVVYMNGCPYCVEVTGKQSVAQTVRDLVPVYEIERSDPLVQKLKVTSFPTIFLSTDDVTFKFEGQRTPDRLRRFVSEKMDQLHVLKEITKRLGQGSRG